MDAQTIVGARLKEIRMRLGYTQLELADRIGCSRVAYAYYEAGKRPPDINFLFSLQALTGYSYDYLLGKTDNTNPETAGLDKMIGLSDKALEVLKTKERVRATIKRLLESDAIVRLSGSLSVFNRFTAYLRLGINSKFDADELEKCDALTESYFSSAISQLRDAFMARDAQDSYYLEMPTSDSLKAYLDEELEVDKRLHQNINPSARAEMHAILQNEKQRKITGTSVFDDEAKEDRS